SACMVKPVAVLSTETATPTKPLLPLPAQRADEAMPTSGPEARIVGISAKASDEVSKPSRDGVRKAGLARLPGHVARKGDCHRQALRRYFLRHLRSGRNRGP